MTSPLYDFLFDVDYSFGNESVFTLVNLEELPPLPPVVGYFLLLDNTPFLLLDNENLTLL